MTLKFYKCACATPHLHKILNLTKKIVSTGQFTFDYKVYYKELFGFQICKLDILRTFANHALMHLRQFHNVNIASYYADKYDLWLDFRTIDDNKLHGSGRRLENTSERIRLQITKETGSAGKLSCYLYVF